jgi:hypothetical protein
VQSPGINRYGRLGKRFNAGGIGRIRPLADPNTRRYHNPGFRRKIAAMGMRIKIRPRAPPPNRWKWEIYDDDAGKLVTASRLAYADRGDAYSAGASVLTAMLGKEEPAS